MFIFNNQLLLIGLDHWFHVLVVIAGAVLAMLAFASGTQGFFITRNRKWETAAMLLITLLLFRPGLVWDRIFPPLSEHPPNQIIEFVEEMDPGTALRMEVKGENLMTGKEFTKVMMLTVQEGENGRERLDEIGFEIRMEDEKVLVDNVMFGSEAEKMGIDFDQEIINIQMPNKRPYMEWLYIPVVGLYLAIWFMQLRRKKKMEALSDTV